MNSGSGWVLYRSIHSSVDDRLREYAKIRPRYSVTWQGGLWLWRRDPDENGHGVARGSQKPDFLRFVAIATSKLPISTIESSTAGTDWRWNYREYARMLVRIVQSGWDATSQEATVEIESALRLELHVHDDGRVTGKVLA